MRWLVLTFLVAATLLAGCEAKPTASPNTAADSQAQTPTVEWRGEHPRDVVREVHGEQLESVGVRADEHAAYADVRLRSGEPTATEPLIVLASLASLYPGRDSYELSYPGPERDGPPADGVGVVQETRYRWQPDKQRLTVTRLTSTGVGGTESILGYATILDEETLGAMADGAVDPPEYVREDPETGCTFLAGAGDTATCSECHRLGEPHKPEGKCAIATATDFSGCYGCHGMTYYKPVIYLYPPRRTPVSVRLDLDGAITVTDPPIGADLTWHVTATPTGVLSDASGRSYPYLFWEADFADTLDPASGSVVAGKDSRSFLDSSLARLGLNAAESKEFIEFWAPRLEANPYNLISFEGPAYERQARLRVHPEPDTVIRVFMVSRALEEPVSIAPQVWPQPRPRNGFTLVEWGGTELKTP